MVPRKQGIVEQSNATFRLFKNIQSTVREHKLSKEEQVKIRTWYLNEGQRHGIRDIHHRLVTQSINQVRETLIMKMEREILTHPDKIQDCVGNLLSLFFLEQPMIPGLSLPVELECGRVVIERPPPLVYRLEYVKWVQNIPSKQPPHELLSALRTAQEDLKEFSLWRFIASDEEIEEAVSQILPLHRRDLEKKMREACEKFDLQAVIAAFDSLIAQKCSDEQHRVIIELLCHDLQLKSWDRNKNFDLKMPKDLSLQLVAFSVGKTSINVNLHSSEEKKEGWKIATKYFLGDHPSHHPEIWSRRVQVWRELDEATCIQFIKDSLADIEKLVFPFDVVPTFTECLQKQFIAEFSKGHEYHVVSAMNWFLLAGDSMDVGDWKATWMPSIFFLIDDDPNKIEEGLKTIPGDCRKHLIELCTRVKQDRHQLVQLLTDVCGIETTRRSRRYLHHSGDLLCWASVAKVLLTGDRIN